MPVIAGTHVNACLHTLRLHFARELTPGSEDGSVVCDDPQGRRLDVACKCISIQWDLVCIMKSTAQRARKAESYLVSFARDKM